LLSDTVENSIKTSLALYYKWQGMEGNAIYGIRGIKQEKRSVIYALSYRVVLEKNVA
jgi:hypothetical protein